MSVHPTFFVVRAWWLTAAALLCSGAMAYWNSFEGGFVDPDDYIAVRDNPYIRRLWPLTHAMSVPLWGTQAPVSPRPVLSLTFAVNYALLGPEPWGYHLVNLMIHLGAGLLLYGVIWRTLESEVIPEYIRFRGLSLAGIIAVLWLVHPVQTESVTYIVQRSESLAGLLMLAALYCAIRGHASQRAGRWYFGAVLACVVGVGVKQHVAVMPVLILVHDAVFHQESYRGALRQHWPLYVGMAVSWVVLGVLQWCARGEVLRDAEMIPPWRWALTQPEVIVHYLRLSLIPRPLVFQYYWPLAQSVWAVWPALVAMIILVGTTVWGVVKRRWWGFVGAWFFLILAPTSSIISLSPACVCREHRLYLPVAAVVTLMVMGIYWLARYADAYCYMVDGWRIIPATVIGALMLTYIGLTVERNYDYRSELRIKLDSVQKRPQNWFASYQVAELARRAGDHVNATNYYLRSLALQPTNVPGWYYMGVSQAELGNYAGALTSFYTGARLAPESTPFELRIAGVYLASGATNAARHAYQRVLERDASNQIAQFHLAQLPEAVEEPARAVQRPSRRSSLRPRKVRPWERADRRREVMHR